MILQRNIVPWMMSNGQTNHRYEMSNQTDILDNVLGITDVVENTTKDVTPTKPVLVPTTTGT